MKKTLLDTIFKKHKITFEDVDGLRNQLTAFSTKVSFTKAFSENKQNRKTLKKVRNAIDELDIQLKEYAELVFASVEPIQELTVQLSTDCIPEIPNE